LSRLRPVERVLILGGAGTVGEQVAREIAQKADIVQHGSAAFDRSRYILEEFIPGDAVGWLLANEADESGMVGHRMF